MEPDLPVYLRPERGIVRPVIGAVTAVPWALAAAADELWETVRPFVTAAGVRAVAWLREVADGG